MAIAGLYKIFDHWHQQGTVHIISDTHFGDEELRAGFPDRPTDEDIVKSINAKVGRKDTLIILGDVGRIVDVPWAFNLHGHDHTGRKSDERHFNVCADVIDYTPINFNQWMKEGYLSKVETIHRSTIDKATAKSKKRKGRKK